ncbi:MAG: response regulator [Candidatus Omnitrophica bacterium]|nr:response regulator [Candidatus Omnitrophota bacterium]
MPEEEKKKILVVDDEEAARTLLRSRLEASGYCVVTACDGLDALEKVTAEKPDLILLDIMMPRMDGSEFLQRMKTEGHLDYIPVIVLTAKANMREFFLVQGAVDFMVKPFLSKNLLAEIEKHLQTNLRT